MTVRGLLLLILLAGSATGCQMFRAEVGFGGGIGAEIKLPYIFHAGLGVGKYKYAGHNYEQGWRAGRADGYWEFSASVLCIIHEEAAHDRFVTRYSDGVHTYREYNEKEQHLCSIILPYVWDVKRHKDTKCSTPLEIKLHLLFVGIRLGIDPCRLSESYHSPDSSSDED